MKLTAEVSRSTWPEERSRLVGLLQGKLHLDNRALDVLLIEPSRCRGRDQKEQRMLRRCWKRDTEWTDEGYYLQFHEVSGPTEKWIGESVAMTEEESIANYNACIILFKFSKGLLIDQPLDIDSLDWDDDTELDWD